MTAPVTESASEWMSTAEVASVLNATKQTLWNWHSFNFGPKPERIRHGRAYRLRYSRSVVDAWIQENLTDENAARTG
jgi:predicted DNA-binding transcriptional regulator AlpA